MKLGRRFVLLTLSIVLFPLLIGAALGIAQWLTGGWSTSVGSFARARAWAEEISTATTASAVFDLIDTRPNGLEIAVADEQNVVRASTMDSVAVGETASFAELFAGRSRAGAPGDDGPEVFLTPLAAGGEAAFLVAEVHRDQFFGGGPPWLPAVVGPVILLTPVILISIWILRDLRKSILTLRDAAVRISSGDLDFALDTTGTDEFSEVRSSFETMRQTIRDEYSRRARFTMGVSHDLKTPLALIKGYAEAIEDGYAEDPATLERYVGIIRERSDLLQERIGHLIEFLKLETGEWFSTLQTVPLRAFLAEFAAAAAADLKLAGGSLRTDIRVPDDVVVQLDPVLVRRALENLVQNAAHHGVSEKPVRFTASASENSVRVGVTNTSTEGEVPDLSLLTEPLYRGDAGRQAPGFGLGLSIVKTVVESHNWQLQLETAGPGDARGETSFVILIPR